MQVYIASISEKLIMAGGEDDFISSWEIQENAP